MAGLDQASAQKLISSLDRELARRRRRKYDALVEKWRAESEDNSAYVLARSIEWQQTHGNLPDGFFDRSEPTDPAERERFYYEEDRQLAFLDAHGGFEGAAEDIAELAQRLLVRDRILQEQRDGAPKRRPLILPPERRGHRMAYGADRPATSSKNGDGRPARKLSRTELHLQKQQAELQARMARLTPPEAGQESSGEWMHGTVQKYDSRTMSGTVAFGGGPGRLELPFGAGAMMRAGLTTLHPTQSVECRIVKRADDTMVIEELRLSVGERAAALAEKERLAEAAEKNYQLTLGVRRPLH